LVLNSLSQLHLAMGNLPVAQEYAQRTVQLNPADAAAHSLLGTVFLRQRQFAKAREQFLSARKLVPQDPSVCVSLARTYIGEKKWADAEQQFRQALEMNPRYTQALAQFANFWVERGQRGKAEALVSEYLKNYPDDANGHYLAGSLSLAGEKYDAAILELDQAIKLDPNLVAAYIELGQVYQARNDLEAAIERYQKALSLQPKSAPLNALIGNLYLHKGDLLNAERYYQQALTVDQDFAVAASNLAWVYTKKPNANLDVALSLAQKARQLLPDVEPIADTLAWVYYKKGLYGSAVPLLQECVDKAPKSAIYRYHLGMALLGAGQKDKAREQLQAALRLNLSGEDATVARETLNR
jgi:tetratricopeptide (TPR) repeat protein